MKKGINDVYQKKGPKDVVSPHQKTKNKPGDPGVNRGFPIPVFYERRDTSENVLELLNRISSCGPNSREAFQTDTDRKDISFLKTTPEKACVTIRLLRGTTIRTRIQNVPLILFHNIPPLQW